MLDKSKNKKIEKNKSSQKITEDKKNQIPIWPMYILLLVFVGIYIIYRSTGPLLFITILIILIIEIVNVLRGDSSKKGILELLIALAAVAIVWGALILALGTSTPLDVVPSCSMLPNLQVGDLILVQNSGIQNIHATKINITQNAMNALINNISNNSYACLAYNPNDPTQVSKYLFPGYKIALYKHNIQTNIFSRDTNQSKNIIHFNCGITQTEYKNNTKRYMAYTKSITINNTTISENQNNSIVVYKTVPQDLFYKMGDHLIVHRAYAILNVSGNYSVLTKGDNNPGLDIQYSNIPPNTSRINGKVIFVIPYLGYIKLALSGIPSGSGCNRIILN